MDPQYACVLRKFTLAYAFSLLNVIAAYKSFMKDALLNASEDWNCGGRH